MIQFKSVQGEDILINPTQIESITERDTSTEIRMISGQLHFVKETTNQIEFALSGERVTY